MPKVARYQQGQTRTQVTRGPQMSSQSGDAVFQSNIGVGQAVEGLALAVVDVKNRIDTTSAEESLVQFEREKNDLFFNPESGYFNTQGKNAYDGVSNVSTALAELKKKYSKGLNPRAQGMFSSAADAHIMNSQKDIDRHASKGLKVWEVSTVKAQTENAIENASLYWNQPEQLGTYRELGRQAVIEAGNMEGVGAEAINENLQTYESSFAASAIEAATVSGAARGIDAMTAYGDRLEGPQKVKLQKMIDTKTEAEKIQEQSQRAIVVGARLADAFDDREEIRKEVNQIHDVEQRKKTMTEAMRQFNLKKQGEAEEQGVAFEGAEDHIYNGGSAETFKAENPEAWNKLSASQKKSLESGGGTGAGDAVLYTDLVLLPKGELAKVNPTEHFHKLNKSQRDKLVTAVKSARNQSTPKQKMDVQVGRTRNAQVSSALEQLLGKKSKWNDDDVNSANAMYDLLDGEIEHRESVKGSPLTSQEFTDVLSGLTREVVTQRNLFGVDYLAPDKDESLADIPPENMRVLSKFLRDNNVPVTAANLLKAQQQAAE